jgi:hypothetical protein
MAARPTVFEPQPQPSPDPAWTCRCGQVYRMVRSEKGVRYWPVGGVAAYSRHGLGPECPCIRCGDRIRGKALSRAVGS